MVYRNLFRRKGRTLLTLVGIAIGVTAILALGALAPGKPVDQGGLGYSCIAEIRMIETIYDGAPKTPFMKPGDQVRVEMRDRDNHSIFGAIEQKVVQA